MCQNFFRFSLILGAVFAVVGCTKPGDVVKARVGDFEIRAKDADQRTKVLRIYQPEDKRDLGLEQLIRFYKLAQILKNNGQKLDDAVLAKESERIDKTTLMPALLKSIKGVFTKDGVFDEKAYHRIFILPQYADRMIYYEFYLNDPTAQKDSLAKAQAFLEASRQAPDAFLKQCLEHEAGPRLFTVTPVEVVWKIGRKPKAPGGPEAPSGSAMTAPPEVQARMQQTQNAQQSDESRAWMRVAETLKPGEVFGQVINNGETWIVARLDKKAGGGDRVRYEMQAAMLPKSDYGKWMEVEDAKVKVQIYK